MGMIKFIGQAAMIVGDTVITSLRMLSVLKKNGGKAFYGHSYAWARRIIGYAGIKLEIEGLENLEPEGQYVFVSNHSSLFDIPALLGSLPGEVRIIYKKELENILIFGRCLRKSPFIAVERSDPRNAMDSIEKAAQSFRQGGSVIVFAEGTRSKDGNLQEFKRGAFMLASRSEMPIVPVAVCGAGSILPKGERYFRPGIVKVRVGSPISPDYPLSRAAEQELMRLVRDEVKKNLEK